MHKLISRNDINIELAHGCADWRITNLWSFYDFGLRRLLLWDCVLMQLHWLPVEQRIEFKLLLVAFKVIRGLAPSYLTEIIEVQTPSRQLRSSKQQLLVVPKARLKSAGERTFGYNAARSWNNLPSEIKSKSSVPSFKRAIKHFYFVKHLSSHLNLIIIFIYV